MKFISIKTIVFATLSVTFSLNVSGQGFMREFGLTHGGTFEIVNRFGRVDAVVPDVVIPEEETTDASSKPAVDAKVLVEANSLQSISESELKITNTGGRVRIEVAPADSKKRIDLKLTLPARSKLKIETREGEVSVSGNLELIEVRTETGTIAADVPVDDVKYDLLWTESRPRFLSDFELENVKEKSGGKFGIKGRFRQEEDKGSKGEKGSEPEAVATGSTGNGSSDRGSSGGEASTTPPDDDTKPNSKGKKSIAVSLNFTTARGIVLLNVPPNEVSSDLRERPLTDAAKAIIRSGDSLLMEAIRRASPKYFGDYAKTLPPMKREPTLSLVSQEADASGASVKRALVKVTDLNNRAIADLKPTDFELTENGQPREILSVEPTTAPFNLVLLLDVSGSVDNYVNFIRKAARSFVNTVDRNDRISIILFNDDTQVLARFTTDKTKLSESLDTFDAGGATAYYDSLAYTLADTLRPLKGERTAIIVLTDGDDNRSFLPFDSLLGSIQESGALIYPLYVPSSLIAASATANPEAQLDPLRSRYINTGLTSKADGEGEKLAKVSGGVYYPITQLSQIQTAYDDIVVQLRTAYTITFRSEIGGTNGKASQRLKVRVKKDNAFVQMGSVAKVSDN